MSLKFCLLLVMLITLMMSPHCGSSVPAECKEFYAKPTSEQQVVFKGYSVERQYEIFRCGTTQRHPPDIGLAGYMADGGEKNIPFLLEKLRTEESEAARRYIIFVFELMSESGDLRGRHDVAAQVEQAVSKLTIPFLKEEGQESLEKIKKSL